MEDGIPYPEQDREVIEQPLRVTLSPSDGSIIKRELLARPKERVLARLARPGTSTEVLVLGLFDHREAIHSNQSEQRSCGKQVAVIRVDFGEAVSGSAGEVHGIRRAEKGA